jgi:putative ABC transport system permease protein
MNVSVGLHIAWRSILRHKMRAALTMLGIVIGVAAVIAMLAIGHGARAQVQAQVESLGSNFLMVLPGATTTAGARSGWGAAPTLTADDAKAIERECDAVAFVSPGIRSTQQVVYRNQNWSTFVYGAGADYVYVRDWPIVAGYFFTKQDVDAAAKVAVLGQTVAQSLFGDEDPIDAVIRIKNVPFRVIGVFAQKGQSVMGDDQDDIVLVPYTTAQRRLMNVTYIRVILATAVNEHAIAEAKQQITQLLRQRHRIGPGEEDDFTVRTQDEVAQIFESTTNVMTLLLGAMASISLLVGGIGIMNIMLVSVTERIREIGIRMAVGARGRDILGQFLIEAVTLSVAGGILGVILGVATAQTITKFAGWQTLLTPFSVILALFFAAAVGIFFGFYPARQAARLDPIEALRYE